MLDLLTTAQQADKVGVEPDTIRKWRQRGKITALYQLPSGDWLYAPGTKRPRERKGGRPKAKSAK